MPVAVPTFDAAGQETSVHWPVAARPEPPRVPAADPMDEQWERKGQERQTPKDYVCGRLQTIVRLGERKIQRVQKKGTADLPSLGSRAALQAQPIETADIPQAMACCAPGLCLIPNHRPRLEGKSAPDPSAPVSREQGSNFAEVLVEAKIRRARQPGPAEIVGLPEALARYDSNGDGHIDQSEMKPVCRAKDERTTYAGLAQPCPPR